VKLYDGEIEFEATRFVTVESLSEQLKNASRERVTVIGIDGRSGGGKTTAARQLAELLGATVLSTDDFAWWHSMFDWPEMIIQNAIAPLRAGLDIDYKPEAWVERERPGSITAKSTQFVILEGVGATQAAMRGALDFCLWVQTDAEVARERGLLRDLAQRPDPGEAEAFWNEWQAAENVFQAREQSWLVADFVMRGNS
jgi:uridine kinase